ncbi:tetratricopeptide repeat protein [Hymenobacter actinosclerus]|uniref:Uncharacterized protein n=1 Tax=Hymenobacter actinosclerus TaxID=82805 RepID=A0A1I0J941_9BACT|nr:tetratricopeptide repeat protein [Hymenobacter actinosclerus]SEU06492.1 hypothetical protein SAMN04487998_3729 [Hymenobacter actinosclerus]
MPEVDLSSICFVVMPFGIKRVGDKDVNFDFIYDEVFVPAIAATPLPEGGYLEARRTDKDFFSADIDIEMYQYIEYSRLSLTDITGLNPNVFYELGVRHRARSSGTVIFRQVDAAIPFDVNHIKAFPYEYEPETQVEESKSLITRVLTESLLNNRLDSPVQIALAAQRAMGLSIDRLLKDAENAIRRHDRPQAIRKYEQAIKLNYGNATLYQEVGLLYKDDGKWNKAAEAFAKATRFIPAYSEAHRELGIAQNKLFSKPGSSLEMTTGEESLKRAIELNDQDFDAYASLGGILKRLQRFEEAYVMYQLATDVSRGHPYPLLNAIRLQVRQRGSMSLTAKQTSQLKRAEQMVRLQTQDSPPSNIPWCFFDLSDIYVFLGRKDACFNALEEGVYNCTSAWQAETHLNSLQLMSNVLAEDEIFKRCIDFLKEEIPNLPQD